MLYIGLDIGGTKCAVSLGRIEDGNIEVLQKTKFATLRNNPSGVLEQFISVMADILSTAWLSYSDIAGIGISCGGPLDSRAGVVLSPPNLPGWDKIPVRDFFEGRTGVKTFLQNDANACAVAEWKFGAGRGVQSLAFLTFGTGLGAGLILNGALYSGHTDMAGEIGHVRLTPDGPTGYGKSGSAEGYCSGGGIAQLAISAVKEQLGRGITPLLLEQAGKLEDIDARIVAQLAREGDQLSLSVYRKSGHMLGVLLSILMDVVNPELIIIGSIYVRDTQLLRPAMLEVIEREALSPCPIVPSGLGEQIGDYAALSVGAGDYYRRN